MSQEIISQPSAEGDASLLFSGNPETQKRRLVGKIFAVVAFVATIAGLIVLAFLLLDVFQRGLPYLNWNFLTSPPSRKPADAGIFTAFVGSLWLLALIPVVAFPLGIGAAIYLEEYAPDNWINRLLEINISNLAGVPSIIYGLLGLELFVRILEPLTGGRSVLAGVLTLSILVLPVVIIASREAIRGVPSSIRQAGFALGATRWQVIRAQVMPMALPGILTGTILALARAIGETAPLVTIGALTYVSFTPPLSLEGLQTPFTALPIQIYNWASRPQTEFHGLSAAGIILLLGVLALMNSVAILLRAKVQK